MSTNAYVLPLFCQSHTYIIEILLEDHDPSSHTVNLSIHHVHSQCIIMQCALFATQPIYLNPVHFLSTIQRSTNPNSHSMQASMQTSRPFVPFIPPRGLDDNGNPVPRPPPRHHGAMGPVEEVDAHLLPSAFISPVDLCELAGRTPLRVGKFTFAEHLWDEDGDMRLPYSDPAAIAAAREARAVANSSSNPALKQLKKLKTDMKKVDGCMSRVTSFVSSLLKSSKEISERSPYELHFINQQPSLLSSELLMQMTPPRQRQRRDAIYVETTPDPGQPRRNDYVVAGASQLGKAIPMCRLDKPLPPLPEPWVDDIPMAQSAKVRISLLDDDFDIATVRPESNRIVFDDADDDTPIIRVARDSCFVVGGYGIEGDTEDELEADEPDEYVEVLTADVVEFQRLGQACSIMSLDTADKHAELRPWSRGGALIPLSQADCWLSIVAESHAHRMEDPASADEHDHDYNYVFSPSRKSDVNTAPSTPVEIVSPVIPMAQPAQARMTLSDGESDEEDHSEDESDDEALSNDESDVEVQPIVVHFGHVAVDNDQGLDEEEEVPEACRTGECYCLRYPTPPDSESSVHQTAGDIETTASTPTVDLILTTKPAQSRMALSDSEGEASRPSSVREARPLLVVTNKPYRPRSSSGSSWLSSPSSPFPRATSHATLPSIQSIKADPS